MIPPLARDVKKLGRLSLNLLKENILKPMAERKHLHEAYIGGREGAEFEWDLFGSVDRNNPAYERELKKVTKPNGSVFYRDALSLVKKFQPGDPKNPERGFARDLRIEILDELGLTDEKDMDRLEFYTAVGSPFDQWHGVDSFFELRQKLGASLRVTLDAATVSELEKIARGQNPKADILISGKELHLDDEAKLEEEQKRIAKQIVAIFRSQQKTA